MSADWFFMKRRWFGRPKKVGPMSEHELLLRIDHGEITPDTLLCSEKTKHRWIKMAQVGPALKRLQQLHPMIDSTL